jgi:hypothetical protein
MSKFHLFTVWFLVLALLLAGCESYNLKPGQAPFGTNVTKPGQGPGGANDTTPGHFPGGINNPDTQTVINQNPPSPQSRDLTPFPNAPLSQTPQPLGNVDVSGWYVFVDNVYQYQINYPPQLKPSILAINDLAKSTPQAAAGVSFNDPARNLAGIALAIFSIRIYPFGTGTPVESWLETHGLYLPDSGWTIEKYQGAHFSGYRVNSTLYMAPGSFIYAVHGNYLYQLTPFGSEAEMMLTTFGFTQ